MVTYGRRGVAAMGALLAGGTLGAALPPRPARAQSGNNQPGNNQPGGNPPVGALREGDPRPLPAFTLIDPEGRERAIGEIVGEKGGQGVVLNLWATWCPPCVEEMPALDRLAAMLAPEGILVLPASSDRGGRAQVEPFFARTGIRNLGIWLDPRSAATRALGSRGLPTTVLIDRLGQERARLEGGATWDGPELTAAVRRLCGAGRAAATPMERS